MLLTTTNASTQQYIYTKTKNTSTTWCALLAIYSEPMVGKDNLWLLRATALVPRPPKSPLTKGQLVKQAGASLPGSSNLDFLFFKPYFCKHVHITWKVRTKSVRFGCNVWDFNQHACSILQDGNLRAFFRQIHERPASGGDSWNKYESCASNKYESCFSRNPEKVERLDQEEQWHTVPRRWLMLELGATPPWRIGRSTQKEQPTNTLQTVWFGASKISICTVHYILHAAILCILIGHKLKKSNQIILCKLNLTPKIYLKYSKQLYFAY